MKYPKTKAALVRLSANEYALLAERAAACAMKLASYIRQQALR